jgi:hypothetical protein
VCSPTDGALEIGESAEAILRREIGKYIELQEESIGPLKIYLWGESTESSTEEWRVHPEFQFFPISQAAVNNVEEYLAKSENAK